MAGWLWLIDPKNNAVITAFALVLGVAGLAVTLAGFGIGWLKLRRIESATNAAKNAVESFKLRLSQYDAVNDATEARYALASIRRHISNGGWKDVAETYDQVRVSTMRLISALKESDLQMLDDLTIMHEQISKFCGTVDVSLDDTSRKFPDKPKTYKMIRDHEDKLEVIKHKLQERAL